MPFNSNRVTLRWCLLSQGLVMSYESEVMRTAASLAVVWIKRVNECQSALSPRLETSEGEANLKLQNRPGKHILCMSLRTGKEITKTRLFVYGLRSLLYRFCSHLQAFNPPAAQPLGFTVPPLTTSHQLQTLRQTSVHPEGRVCRLDY